MTGLLMCLSGVLKVRVACRRQRTCGGEGREAALGLSGGRRSRARTTAAGRAALGACRSGDRGCRVRRRRSLAGGGADKRERRWHGGGGSYGSQRTKRRTLAGGGGACGAPESGDQRAEAAGGGRSRSGGGAGARSARPRRLSGTGAAGRTGNLQTCAAEMKNFFFAKK
ncbi:protein argonaute 2-like [Cryptomeria japonica]|uniref:protein argonaute 2-like n=1 Tax=Cryptomeria japonica TaxID=3369 RepID=UPI0027DA5D0B|nr:protein argonaute 2-like [Cryptomeria japonica]